MGTLANKVATQESPVITPTLEGHEWEEGEKDALADFGPLSQSFLFIK